VDFLIVDSNVRPGAVGNDLPAIKQPGGLEAGVSQSWLRVSLLSGDCFGSLT